MIAAGTVLRRREPVDPDDAWNRVRVTGTFEGEVTLTSADTFTETISATVESLTLAYAVESAPEAAQPWATRPQEVVPDGA